MKRISRRTALGSVAASALVGLGAKAGARNLDPKPLNPVPGKTDRAVKTMTLEEFRQMNGEFAEDDVFRQIEGHTFSKCHEEMRDKHGIWIPELVPVFEQLDARRAASV